MPVLFYSYFTIGIISVVLGLAVGIVRNKIRDARGLLLFSLRSVMFPASFIQKARFIAIIIFSTLESIIMWPPRELSGFFASRKKPILDAEKSSTYLNSQSLEPQLALYTAGVILLFFIDARTSKSIDIKYEILFVTLLGSAVVFRHTRYIIDADGLPAHLRRSSGNPYTYFLLILLCDLLSLTFSSTVLINQSNLSALSWQDIFQNIKNLFGFRRLLGIFSGQSLAPTEIAVSIAGLFFYLALSRTIFKLKDFHRSDADLNWIASQNIQFGNFTNALRILRDIKAPTPDTTFLEAMAYLGVNQSQKAEERIRTLFYLKATAATNEEIFYSLVDTCLMLPTPSPALYSIIARGKELKVPDAYMQDAICAVLLVNERAISELENIFSELEAVNYPLTCATIYIATNQLSRAYDLLESLRPRTQIEDLIRMLYMLKLSLMSIADREKELIEYYRKWASENLPIVLKLISNLDKERDYLIAFMEIQFLRFCSEQLLPERAQEIYFFLDEMRNRLRVSETGARALKVIEKRIEMSQRVK